MSNEPAPNTALSFTFAEAELGGMKQVFDTIHLARTKGEQLKASRLITSYVSQMSRVRKQGNLQNLVYTGHSTVFDIEENSLQYVVHCKVASPATKPTNSNIGASEL
jgi:hypothetical protein